MPKSAVKPEAFWIRRKDVENDIVNVTMRVRWDITQGTIVAEGQEPERTEWGFEEQEIVVAIELKDLDDAKEPDAQIRLFVKTNEIQLQSRAQKQWKTEHGAYADKWQKKAVELVA